MGNTPVAVVERGTTPHQRVSRTSCGFPQHVVREAVLPPALLIVGAVAEHNYKES